MESKSASEGAVTDTVALLRGVAPLLVAAISECARLAPSCQEGSGSRSTDLPHTSMQDDPVTGHLAYTPPDRGRTSPACDESWNPKSIRAGSARPRLVTCAGRTKGGGAPPSSGWNTSTRQGAQRPRLFPVGAPEERRGLAPEEPPLGSAGQAPVTGTLYLSPTHSTPLLPLTLK